LLIFGVGFMLMGCGSDDGSDDGVARLLYTFWGSDMERRAQMDAVEMFNQLHEGRIVVTPLHIPAGGGEYATRMTAMQAAGNNPDVGYMATGQAFVWAQEGIFFNIFDLIDADPYWTADMFVENIFYMYAEGRSFGTTSSINPFALFYDPAVFDEHGVPHPPNNYADAWTWDQFIYYARLLTIDMNGNNATHPDFDHTRVRQWGAHFNPDDISILHIMLDSNGADLLNEEGTALALNTPQAKEVLQKLYDMIYVHRISPIPADYANLPTGPNAIHNRQFAMVATGYWNILDFHTMEVPFEVGVLPRIRYPRNIILAGTRVIWADTEYPEAAWELYTFLADPAGAMNLYRYGLWMPTLVEWYTDRDKFEQWAGEGSAHPPNFEPVFVYPLFNGVATPNWVLRVANFEELINMTVRPGLQQLWFDDMTVDQVVADVEARANPFVRGWNPGNYHASHYHNWGN